MIQEIIEKRSALETELKNLEKQILESETKYLEDTMLNGNVIRGWDGYLLNKNSKNQPFSHLKKPKINNNERIFSLSSLTSPAIKNVPEENENINFKNHLLMQSSQYRSKRNKKKKNYAQINDGASNYKKGGKIDEKALLAVQVSANMEEEIYHYDKVSENSDDSQTSDGKSKNSKLKKNGKKYSQKIKKSKTMK